MSIAKFFQSLIVRSSGRTVHNKPTRLELVLEASGKRRTAFRLTPVEPLEDRSVPAALTWDGTGSGGTGDGAGVWDTAAKWWNGSSDSTWASGSDAVFGNGGAGGAVTLTNATAVNSLTLNSFTGTYTLGTAAKTITLNNGITVNSGAGATTIISPITLGGPQNWINNSASLLTVGTGAVTNGGNLLTVGGSGNTTISSIIGAGAGGLTKQDGGTLILSGANSYTGPTTINANGGILQAGIATNAFGNKTAVTVNNGGTLNMNSLSQTIGSLAGGGNVTLGSAATTLTLNGTGVNANFSGNISGGLSGQNAAFMTVNITGTQALSGTANFSGGWLTLQGGTLSLGLTPANFTWPSSAGSLVFTGGTLQYTSANTNDYSARLNTSAPNAQVKLDINGQNVTWGTGIAGSLTLSSTAGGGTFTTSAANGMAGATTINGGTLNLKNQSAVANSTVTMSGGSLSFDSSITGNAFTLGGLAASSSGAGYDIALQNNAGSPAAIAATVGNNNASTTYAGNLTGAGSLIKIGTGTLILSGSNSYTGPTTVATGNLQYNAASAIAGSGRNITVNTGTTAVMNYTPAGSYQTDIFSRIVPTSAGAVALNAGTVSEDIDLSSSGNNLTALAIGANGAVTYTGTLTPNGTTYRLGGGGGTLTFTPASYDNTKDLALFSGGLSGGVDFGGLSKTFGNITIAGGTTQNGTLTGSAFTANNASAAAVSAILAGSGATLSTTGAGTLTLSAANTYSGATTLNAGTLTLSGAAGALTATNGLTLKGGALTLINTSATEAALDRLNNSAAIVSNGGGAITVTNTASGTTVYSEMMGALDLRKGQLNVTQTNANTTPNQTLTFDSGSLTTVNGNTRAVTDTSAVTFSGASAV